MHTVSFQTPVIRVVLTKLANLKRVFKSNWSLAISGGLLLFCVLMAVFAPMVTPQNPFNLLELDMLDARLPPGSYSTEGGYTYWLGTDGQGRDIYSAIIYGLRTSLFVGLVGTSIAAVVGVIAGLIAGYQGGRLDGLLMRLVDFILSFPTILMALMILAYMGKGVGNVILTIIVLEWAYYARAVRAEALVYASSDFVEAARGQALPVRMIMMRYILPNCLPPLLVLVTLQVARAIMLEATLSFLGLGVPVTEPSLGLLIANGYQFLLSDAYWISIFPGLALFILIVTINLVGEYLRKRFNPQEDL